MLGLNYLVWIGIVSWIVVPLLALLTTVLLWRRSQTSRSKALALAAGIAIVLTPALISNGVKAYYDRQVSELCAKDGGVEIYETVVLPAEQFDKLKQRNFVLFSKALAEPNDEYYRASDDRYYKQGFINFVRMESRIVRRNDGKVLGKSIRYGRVGGDLPGPWHHSSFTCPDPGNPLSPKFETVIFQRGDEQ